MDTKKCSCSAPFSQFSEFLFLDGSSGKVTKIHFKLFTSGLVGPCGFRYAGRNLIKGLKHRCILTIFWLHQVIEFVFNGMKGDRWMNFTFWKVLSRLSHYGQWWNVSIALLPTALEMLYLLYFSWQVNQWEVNSATSPKCQHLSVPREGSGDYFRWFLIVDVKDVKKYFSRD